MQTVIGAFDDRTRAERAVDKLVKDGFDRSDLHIEQQDAGTADVGSTRAMGDQTMEDHHPVGGIGHFFAHLFGTDQDDTYREQADTYHEAVRRGSSIVVVDARDDAQAERAVSCLHDAGAINVDERAQQWRSEGWTGGSMAGRQAETMRPSANDARTTSTLRDDAPPVGKEGVLDVVQEELRVGKRSLDKGGVRVIQRVSEQPVREVVRLREERAIVDRRPVDRPAEAGEMNAFREGTLEVREMAEEPVVSKTARVVEEVRVGKQVNEREETIEDRVRRKDVDVERMGGERRERAVAADTRDPLSADKERERERDLDATGTRIRKNDPAS
jgi:uncharacterized protein (TIGR02271 family)